jgi:hypothetical protein
MNGGLTKSQQLHDFETDKAREMLTGLTPEEIKHRTSKFSNTGRDNPDYDPSIATRLRLAGRRKYGDDPYFDNLRPEHAQSESYSAPVVNPIERFSSDPAMKNYKPGKQTASGLEVLDSSGKLVGHYK